MDILRIPIQANSHQFDDIGGERALVSCAGDACIVFLVNFHRITQMGDVALWHLRHPVVVSAQPVVPLFVNR